MRGGWGLLARGALKLDILDTEDYGIHGGLLCEFKPDGAGTTALVVGDNSSLRRAGSDMLAGRTIGHVIDDLDISLLGGHQVKLADGEGLIAAGRDLRGRLVVLGEFRLNALARKATTDSSTEAAAEREPRELEASEEVKRTDGEASPVESTPHLVRAFIIGIIRASIAIIRAPPGARRMGLGHGQERGECNRSSDPHGY